jgi:uncharacterized membrane protein
MERSPTSLIRLSTRDLAVAGILGALSIVLSATPLGLIPVPNISAAATTLHIPAIIAGLISGPVVGALVGLVLAFTSWYYYSALFLNFMGGNLVFALLAAFLPRVLIGVFAYYAYRALRPWPPLAAGAAGLVGTLTNSIGVLGLLLLLGTPDVAALIPVILTNVPFEIILAVVITIPVVAALRAAWRGGIAAARE